MDAVAAVRARLEALSAGHAPVAQSQSAPLPATLAPSRRLSLELPALAQDELDALVDELALMGTVSSQLLEDGRLRLSVDTAQSADDVLAICSFIVDPDSLAIVEDGGGRLYVARRQLWLFRAAAGTGRGP